MSHTPEQKQFVLELADVRLRLPWEGRSPRELTKVQMSLFSSQEAQKSMSEFKDPAQLEFCFERQKRAPRKYGGSPSLLEHEFLKQWENDHGKR